MTAVSNLASAPRSFWGSELDNRNTNVGWLWQGYLAAGNVTLLTSQWKSGKTTLGAEAAGTGVTRTAARPPPAAAPAFPDKRRCHAVHSEGKGALTRWASCVGRWDRRAYRSARLCFFSFGSHLRHGEFTRHVPIHE